MAKRKEDERSVEEIQTLREAERSGLESGKQTAASGGEKSRREVAQQSEAEEAKPSVGYLPKLHLEAPCVQWKLLDPRLNLLFLLVENGQVGQPRRLELAEETSGAKEKPRAPGRSLGRKGQASGASARCSSTMSVSCSWLTRIEANSAPSPSIWSCASRSSFLNTSRCLASSLPNSSRTLALKDDSSRLSDSCMAGTSSSRRLLRTPKVSTLDSSSSSWSPKSPAFSSTRAKRESKMGIQSLDLSLRARLLEDSRVVCVISSWAAPAGTSSRPDPASESRADLLEAKPSVGYLPKLHLEAPCVQWKLLDPRLNLLFLLVENGQVGQPRRLELAEETSGAKEKPRAPGRSLGRKGQASGASARPTSSVKTQEARNAELCLQTKSNKGKHKAVTIPSRLKVRILELKKRAREGISKSWTIDTLRQLKEGSEGRSETSCDVERSTEAVNRVEVLRRKLGFDCGLGVDSNGRSGGLAIWWKEELQLTVRSFSSNHINCELEVGGRVRLTVFMEIQRLIEGTKLGTC
ncbi:hypothetical protein QQ045_003629 [Rhodiola kirilowii]